MNRERFLEIVRFLIAGAAGFAVQFVVLTLLVEKLGFGSVIANGIAFIVSVIVNYLICVFWVFHGAKEQNAKGKAAFFLTSAIGFVLNLGLMELFRVFWGEDHVLFAVFSFDVKQYMVNVCLVTCIVMIWNYFTKKRILTR